MEEEDVMLWRPEVQDLQEEGLVEPTVEDLLELRQVSQDITRL